jgi:ATP synthase protein I
MTTAPLPTGTPAKAVRIGPDVLVAAGSTLLLGVLAVVLAALVSGTPGALGAGTGAAMVLVFFGVSALVVSVVASVSPSASLLVALLTYTLQVVLVALVFVALQRSGRLGSTVDPNWLSGTMIAATVVWLGAQVLCAVRARQPLYDLPVERPEQGRDDHEASAR